MINPKSHKKMLGAQASRLPFPIDGWRSRGYLPHFEQPGAIQAITFRLADSLPRSILDQWEVELALLPSERRQTEREKRIAAWLDRGAGECHLRDPRVADRVQKALLYFDGERYRLIAWCLMPNHVHVMIEAMSGHPLAEVLHS